MPNAALKSSVPVALLYQTGQRGAHLKDALNELGAAIVYESLATDFDREALESSGARIVVFNLDADSEAHIEHVYDVLDAGNYEVVFNDDDVSANLSGWDQARWARHLAAKILHKPEISAPPRPLGAEAVPTPVQKSAAGVPVAERPGEQLVDHVWLPLAHPEPSSPMGAAPVSPVLAPPEESLTQPLTPAKVEPTLPESDFTAGSMELDADAPHIAQVPSSEAPTLRLRAIDRDAGNLDAHQTSALDAPQADFGGSDFGSALDEFLRQAPAAPQPTGGSQDFASELDALFADTRGRSDAKLAQASAAEDDNAIEFSAGIDVPDEEITLTDVNLGAAAEELPGIEFPAIFDQFDAAAAQIPEATDGAFKPAPLTEQDHSPPQGALPTQAPAPSAPLVPPEWLLEPVEDEDSKSAAPTASASEKASFGIETIPADEFLAPQIDRQVAAQTSVDLSSLELMPMEEAVAPETYANPDYQSESWLDGSRPAQKLKVGTALGVQQVYVLGASIGGPEAVRDFLAALPAGFPALFVLTQHMGEEFLELMSAQLAKAVALTVRNPSHGERVAHGEIVVVPTTHRLQIDAEGVITLAHLPERTAYNPSIDLVLRDVADQFGDKAGAIIFSGMAKDAVEGSKYLKAKGGTIWAQDPDTCAISTMVDGVKQAGVISFIGSPAELAAKMIAEVGRKQG